LGLKPNEFWELQPKDITIMYEGFLMRCEREEALQLETLRLLRYNAYTNYIGIPTKKGSKKSNITEFYPLPKDKEKKIYTQEEIKQGSNRKEAYITNGKLRGYLDTKGQLWNKQQDTVIANMTDGELIYIN
jgi:hypothetical protein